MPGKNSYTSEMRMDISNLKKSMQEAGRQIRMAQSEFKAATAGMDKWGDSTEGLSAKIREMNIVAEAEKKKLEDLKKQYEIVAEAEGETSAGAENLQIKINRQIASVRSAEGQLARYSQRLAEMEKDQEEAVAAAQRQTGTLDELKDTISRQEKELDTLKQEYASASLEFGKNSDRADELAEKIQALSGELAGNRAKIADAARAADDLDSSMVKAENATEDASDGFTTMKGVIANLIAEGIKALAKEAVESLGEIVGATDEACKNFQTKTGASTESMKEFKEQISDLYQSGFGDSMNEVADAMAEVKQQTGELDPSVLREMTENAMTLSDTFGYDVKEQLRAVKMLTDQFGISSEEAYNLLVQGAQKGLDKNGDLLDTINEYAVHYQQLGYNAEEFFNSLESGTEAGTFSVDKLGDAVKEFGIRTKDTATTSREGFELLGYSARKSEEEIKKTEESIEKLERNLRYAKMEQEGFNKKTSELTRQKNADKIDEYTSSLEEAKKKLQTMQSTGKDTKDSIDDLQKSFAAGGKKAQKATNEVIKKLLNMKDKVKQNQAGVDLFGTMWEDLGVEGVKALMKTNGTMDKTKKSMEEIKKIRYSDVKSRFKELGRTVQMDLLVPLAEKAIPKIEEFATKAIDHIDEITAGVKVAGTIFGTAFAAKKIIDFASGISTMVTTFRTAKTAIEGAATAQEVLNVAQAASPIGLLIAGVGALVGALITFNAEADKTEEKYAGLTEEEKKNREAMEESNAAWRDSKKAREEAIHGAREQFSYYAELKGELDELIDKNGKIKEGEKDRAEFIINTLNEALGTELKINGNIVKNYDEQKKKLGELIKTKEAQVVLARTEEKYSEAIEKRTEALTELTTEQEANKKVSEQAKKAEEELKKLQDEGLKGYMEKQGIIQATAKVQEEYQAKLQGAERAETIFRQRLEESNKKLWEAESKLADYNATIENYESLSEAVLSGSQKRIKKALNNMENNLITAKTGNERLLKEQVESMKKNLENVKTAIKNGTPGVTKESQKMAEKILKKAEKELDKFEESGKNAVKGLEKGLTGEEVMKLVSDAAAKVAELARTSLNKNLQIHSPSKVTEKTGMFFVQGFIAGIINKIKAVGETVSRLAKRSVSELIAANRSGQYEQAGNRVAQLYKKGIEEKSSSVEKAIGKLVDKAVSQAKRKTKDKKTKSAFEKLGESMMKSFSEAYEKAAEKAADKVQSRIESLTKTTQEKYDAIKNLQEDLEKRLSSGELYKENEDGTISLTDFASETEKIRKLGNNLQILKKKLSSELMSEIAAMDTEEGLKLTSKLLSISDSELKSYNDAYTKKLQASSKAAASYYKDQIKALQNKYSDKVKRVMKDLDKQLEKIGENAMKGFIKGFNSKDNEMIKAVKRMSTSLVRQIKKELGIKSPSKVMRDMVGRFIPAGVAEGIRRNTNEVEAAMTELRDNIVMPMKAAVSGIRLGETGQVYTEGIKTEGNTGNSYYFHQENHSPKALSRWDLYRQSKNLLEGVNYV